MDLTSITPDAAGLRALAHPARLRILGHLRSDGPATATSLAARMGLNSGATSYHLRTLAKHGFVVDDAERGNARERWWRAAHQSTRSGPDDYRTPDEQDALEGFLQAVAIVQTERLQRFVEERSSLSPAWEAATTVSDWELRLTPRHARDLKEALTAVLEGWEEDPEDAEDESGRAALFQVAVHAFPRSVPEDDG
ncbi:transcriptional regulator [Nocardioides sp. CFH 31398]|uniref:ArsR/SmtB family transcription factor n=1 Tax=Nocardioides sp. CFH 31398 TaxID=2919579 RepID=UPI001F06CEC5|nr:helix-turn-helix domain-containing protein [Nocardioides sp. CFH 31398]MCH1864906.1 helix-turn-helix domain-containing protein [Nocardioides sp. CFH 31398]